MTISLHMYVSTHLCNIISNPCRAKFWCLLWLNSKPHAYLRNKIFYLFFFGGGGVCALYVQIPIKSFNAYCKLFLCIQHSHLMCELMQKCQCPSNISLVYRRGISTLESNTITLQTVLHREGHHQILNTEIHKLKQMNMNFTLVYRKTWTYINFYKMGKT